jgi:hypothetical protein
MTTSKQDFDPGKFVKAAHKLHRQCGVGDKFTRQFGELVFRWLVPPGLRFEQVACRIQDVSEGVYTAEMFVLGYGLLTVTVEQTQVGIHLNKEICELESAPSWVSGGDRSIGPVFHQPGTA